MVQILPFCGFRYDLSQVGALFDVTCPPNSLIDEAQQTQLYRLHPCNSVRLAMNRAEPGDSSAIDQSNRADDFWRLWKRERVLLMEHDVAFYVIETTYTVTGIQKTRWSVIARLQLPPQDSPASSSLNSIVKPDAASVQQQLELRKVCHAVYSPVIGLIDDTTGVDSDPRTLSDHLEFVVRQTPPIECIDDVGVRHRLWPMVDQKSKTELEVRLSQLSVCIVGGGAEFVAAIRHRDELVAAGQLADPNSPLQSILVCLTPADDPGLRMLPRVQSLKSSASITQDEVKQILSKDLLCQFVGSEPNASDDAAELAELSEIQPCVAVGTTDGAWMIVSPVTNGFRESSQTLADRIARMLQNARGDIGELASQTLPLSFTQLASFIESASKSAKAGLFVVQPPLTASDVVLLAENADVVPEEWVRLNPSIPTGLVFASLDQ